MDRHKLLLLFWRTATRWLFTLKGWQTAENKGDKSLSHNGSCSSMWDADGKGDDSMAP